MGCNELALSWKDHHGVLFNVFEKLLAQKALVDCTLAAEGKILKAHRIVLSACSPYFETILNQEYDKHPIIFLRDVHFEDLKTLIEFVYSGEIKIPEDRLVDFLSLAEALQIKGLGGVGNEVHGKGAHSSVSRTKASNSPVPRKRSRRQSNVSEENSSESNDSASAVLSEESNRTQHSGEDKVHKNVPSVSSASHVSHKVSDEVSVDISKVKKEISTSPVLNQSSCSEQLPSDNATDKNDEILGLKPEFAQVTFTENYSDDLLPEDNNSVEPMLDQEQPSSSHQYSGFVGEPVDPAELPVPSAYPVGNIEQPSPSEGLNLPAGDGGGAVAVAGAASVRKFECPACAQVFPSEPAMCRHLLSHKGKTAPFSCSRCPAAFAEAGELAAHLSTHGGASSARSPGARPFACIVCRKRFAHNHSLKEHVRLHTGERPYTCTYCGKGFVRSDSLSYHVRTHTGERPYTCPLCGKSFRMKQHMQNHLRTHAND